MSKQPPRTRRHATAPLRKNDHRNESVARRSVTSSNQRTVDYQATSERTWLFSRIGSRIGLWLVLSLTAASDLCAEDFRDFSAELPRVEIKPPDEALSRIRLDEQFELELVAAEPLVVDPIAVAFDHQGAMYVVEMRGYSEDAEDDLGRIRHLQDLDGDGKYETSKVFAEGLSWPTAVTCYDNGVFVAAAPYLFYLKDTDNDGIADLREVIFEGFGRHNVQGLVNTLKWGPDNRIHGATSSTGASLVRPGEGSQPLQLKGRDFSFNPRTLELRATSGGGQHGLSFNRWGEKFVCSNSDHIQQITYDDRVLRRNPHFRPPAPRVSIAADGPQADVFRASPIEPWREIRTRLRVTGRVPGPIEGGGTAAGYFTGATGITIYRGDNWPNRFVDWAFICDVGSNLIHRKRLVRNGSRYVAQRFDHNKEFLVSPDVWFRPVQLANAPDGSLFVLDMAREVIEHPDSLPPPIKQHLDLTSGRDRGRILRIIAKAKQPRRRVDLGAMTPLQLVDLLEHTNGWHRETAARLLFERNSPSIIAPTKRLLRNSQLPEAKIRALYMLATFDQLSSEDLSFAMRAESEHVRRVAFELAVPRLEQADRLRDVVLSTEADALASVALQQAFALGSLAADNKRQQAMLRLALAHHNDRLVLAALQTGLGTGAASFLVALAEEPVFANSPTGLNFISGLAAQTRRQALQSEIPVLAAYLADSETTIVTQRILQEVAANTPWCKTLKNQIAPAILNALFKQSRDTAANQSLSLEHRAPAIQLLANDELERCVEIYRSLLAPNQSREIQSEALSSLGKRTEASVAELLLDGWSQLGPTLRQTTAKILASRAPWKESLLTALETGHVNLSDLSAYQRQRLQAQTPPKRWNAISPPRETDESVAAFLEKYRRAASSARTDATTVRGRTTFRAKCAVCHRLEEHGNEIGPNLAAMRARGADAIVTNVLHPNQEVNPQYVNYVVLTTDGRTFSGLIHQETETSIELLAADNKRTVVLRSEIDELTSTGKSLMPVGWDREITPHQLADIVAYLLQIE